MNVLKRLAKFLFEHDIDQEKIKRPIVSGDGAIGNDVSDVHDIISGKYIGMSKHDVVDNHTTISLYKVVKYNPSTMMRMAKYYFSVRDTSCLLRFITEEYQLIIDPKRDPFPNIKEGSYSHTVYQYRSSSFVAEIVRYLKEHGFTQTPKK